LSTAKLGTEQLKNRFSDIAIFAATRENDNILILEAVKGVSLLGVGICSLPERITEIVLSFTRAVCKQTAELSIL
jgi:hypothetical protein